MTDSETRVLARTAAVLLIVSAGRYGWELRRDPPVEAGARSDLPALIAESRRLEEDGRRRNRPLGAAERIDPNRAVEAELDRLPGVGPGAARAIVESREREGAFTGPEDLLRVRGIGAATLDRMRPYLEFRAGRVVGQGVGADARLPAVRPTLDLNRAGAA